MNDSVGAVAGQLDEAVATGRKQALDEAEAAAKLAVPAVAALMIECEAVDDHTVAIQAAAFLSALFVEAIRKIPR